MCFLTPVGLARVFCFALVAVTLVLQWLCVFHLNRVCSLQSSPGTRCLCACGRVRLCASERARRKLRKYARNYNSNKCVCREKKKSKEGRSLVKQARVAAGGRRQSGHSGRIHLWLTCAMRVHELSGAGRWLSFLNSSFVNQAHVRELRCRHVSIKTSAPSRELDGDVPPPLLLHPEQDVHQRVAVGKSRREMKGRRQNAALGSFPKVRRL